MNFLVISHTPHIKYQGSWYGWGPTVRELNFLALQFHGLRHIAPVEESDSVPESFEQVGPHIEIIPTVNRGGPGWTNKIKVLFDSFQYARLIIREIRPAALVHVRSPANISLIALLVLVGYPSKPKWIKYAGDWYRKKDFFSYSIQRLLVRRYLTSCLATINAFPRRESANIVHVFNPSYFRDETIQGRSIAATKQLRRNDWVLLFAGGLTENKGPRLVILAFAELVRRGYSGKLVFAGDGVLAEALKGLAREQKVDDRVSFTGWKSKEELKEFYAQAHFVILPSVGEGWPKVISEGMSYGAIPIVSDVSEMKKVLADFRIGKVLSQDEPNDYASAIENYLKDPVTWKIESQYAVDAATNFTFEFWWEQLTDLFRNKLQNFPMQEFSEIKNSRS